MPSQTMHHTPRTQPPKPRPQRSRPRPRKQILALRTNITARSRKIMDWSGKIGLTKRIFDPSERCRVRRFAVSSLVDCDHAELIFVALQWIGVDELGAFDRSSCDLHPARIVGRARLDHVADDRRPAVGHRLRPRDLDRASSDVAHLGVTWSVRLGYSARQRVCKRDTNVTELN